MSTVAELLDANVHRVFGNRDADSRHTAIQEVYAESVVFSDPEGRVVGRSALEAKAAALLDSAPAAFEFVEDGPAYVGESFGALAWAFGPPGAPVARGIDLITVENGMIVELRTALAS